MNLVHLVPIGNAGWGWNPTLRLLARTYATVEALRGHPELRRFFDWVAKRPPGWRGKVR